MRNYFSNTFLYFLSGMLARALGFLLIPLYTHFISPHEYGIWGIAGTVSLFLGTLMSLGMPMAVGRFYFDGKSDEERANTLGTIFFVLAVFPLILLIMFEWAGEGIFGGITPGVPYKPYMQLVAWSTYFSNFSVVPLMVLRSRQEAKRYVVLNLGQAITIYGLAVFLVAFARLGVLGIFLANLAASILFMPVYVWEILKHRYLRFSTGQLSKVLKYALPLLPHAFAGWILINSDRLILARNESLTIVGIYTLGYSIGIVVQNFADGATSAWFPTFFASESTGSHQHEVIKAASYIIISISALATGFVISMHHLASWFLPGSYRGAEAVIAWVAASGILVQVYYLLSYSIHYSKKTIFVFLISSTAALTNVCLNLLLVPRFGYLAAAANTFVAYLVMAILSSFIGHRIHPVPHEYRRWSTVIGLSILLIAMSTVRPRLSELQDAVYSTILLLGWPAGLWFSGVLSQREKRGVTSRLGVALHLLRRETLWGWYASKRLSDRASIRREEA